MGNLTHACALRTSSPVPGVSWGSREHAGTRVTGGERGSAPPRALSQPRGDAWGWY